VQAAAAAEKSIKYGVTDATLADPTSCYAKLILSKCLETHNAFVAKAAESQAPLAHSVNAALTVCRVCAAGPGRAEHGCAGDGAADAAPLPARRHDPGGRGGL
jgi:hypothetical protein